MFYNRRRRADETGHRIGRQWCVHKENGHHFENIEKFGTHHCQKVQGGVWRPFSGHRSVVQVEKTKKRRTDRFGPIFWDEIRLCGWRVLLNITWCNFYFSSNILYYFRPQMVGVVLLYIFVRANIRFVPGLAVCPFPA